MLSPGSVNGLDLVSSSWYTLPVPCNATLWMFLARYERCG